MQTVHNSFRNRIVIIEWIKLKLVNNLISILPLLEALELIVPYFFLRNVGLTNKKLKGTVI